MDGCTGRIKDSTVGEARSASSPQHCFDFRPDQGDNAEKRGSTRPDTIYLELLNWPPRRSKANGNVDVFPGGRSIGRHP